MARVMYPITANYVHTWTPKRGIAELVSNALDGARANGRPHRVHYDSRKRVLTLTNVETTLDRNALLLGESSKRDDDDETIGQFGEGLKLGCLVLRRERFPVTIKNGRYETWKPEIELVDLFDKPVLVMHVTKANRQCDDLVVEIEGVDDELWESVRALFLDLRDVGKKFRRETRYGDLLIDPEEVGNIYVRGVFICHAEHYSAGYNLKNTRVGRDREIPNSYDLESNIKEIWGALIPNDDAAVGTADVVQIYDLLNSDRPEGHAFKYLSGSHLAPLLGQEFQRRHGSAAIPVTSTAESAELAHLNAVGVVVHENLQYALINACGVMSGSTFRRKVRFDTSKVYESEELTVDELARLNKIVTAFRAIGIDIVMRLSVVDFRGPNVRGLHEGEKILLARRCLSTFGEAVSVVIHEVAHDQGRDGTHEHVSAVADLTAKLFNSLAGES